MALHRAAAAVITTFLLFILSLFAASTAAHYARNGDDKDESQTYVVRIRSAALHGTNTSSDDQRRRFYGALFRSAGFRIAEPRLLHSYSNVMTGFAARLTKDQVEALSKTDWFANAYPAGGIGTYSLQTTYTPRFLGLERNQGLWNSTNMGEGIIIGVLDTDILPSHPSFQDDGMPPPPSKWKGRCNFRAPYHCNNKLIGATTFVNTMDDGTPPLPTASSEGHGTHTASTAAGNFVENASAFGSAMGTMSGIAPRAHIAFYKVCSPTGNCDGYDIQAAMVAATNDGVDVISLSVGGDEQYHDLYHDGTAVGSFYAMSKGVFVSISAGNGGPKSGTLEGTAAPWQLTVAASSTDRRMLATVKLGNGREINGESIYQPKDHVPEQLPLVLLRTGANVTGKIVVCGAYLPACAADVIKKAGGAGAIYLLAQVYGYTIGFSSRYEQYQLPASSVSNNDWLKIEAYLQSTTNPTAAIIFKGTATGAPWSPAICSGSSRGPSLATPGILKPDITGPGVNILAAVSSPIGPPGLRSTGPFFAIESGTSMSTPHLSGVAALIKKVHPDWSPAAIKSAMMTTADILDRSGKLIVDERRLHADLFALGAGHVNPSKAADPGLVYDISVDEYIGYLCGGLGYSQKVLQYLTKRENDECSNYRRISERDLNYPSITVSFASASRVTVTRTVTNVGEAQSRYEVQVDVPEGISASAKPNYLEFSKAGEKKTFRVAFETSIGRTVGARGQRGNKLAAKEGQLRLISAMHTVRSPISILFQ